MTPEFDRAPRRWLAGSVLLVAGVAAAKLLVHLATSVRYGLFVDELYFFACSQHLDWGYVDQPPLIAAVAWVVRHTLGQSLPAVRFVPALAGTAVVILAALIARELGGGRFAQGMAALATLVAPGLLVMDGFLTMNAFEPLFWLGCAYTLLRIIRTGNERLWLWFGLLAGLGLLNKHSMAIFGAGIVLGLLLTPQRRLLRSRWFWLAGLAAFVIFLPNLLWNVQHHFPFLEIQENIRRSGRNVAMPPLKFMWEETLAMLPPSAPIWLAGLWTLLCSGRFREYRALGWAFLFTAGVIMALSPRVYYLFPAFPLLFAAGSTAWEGWLARRGWRWLKWSHATVMVVSGAVSAPLVIPVLPPETYIRYTEALHYEAPRIETHRLGPLQQLFADQFGWPEMAAVVARAYHALPPDVRAKTAIFGQNYGQAGAIDYYGPKYGLPPALSGHQNYFLWGPRGHTGESMIVLGDTREALERHFTYVEKVGRVEHPYSMPYERFDVYYCRGMRRPLAEVWPKIRRWG